jgi:hypothetical protein
MWSILPRLWVAILLIGISVDACLAETQPPPPPAKTDIWGFYPGMKEAEFSAALRANNLSCEGRWDIKKGVTDNFISCYLQNEPVEQHYGRWANSKRTTQFFFYQTRFLSPNVIWNVTYDFFSGKSREELISQISSIYGFKPAPLSPQEQHYSIVCSRALGPAAIWKSGTRTLVFMDDESYIVREGISIDGWSLVLCDEQFLAKDNEAFEQKKRSVGPPTKF